MASISMSEIKTLVGSTSNSLREYSRLAGFSAPDSMTEFIGYNPTPDPIDFTYTAGGVYKNEGTLLVTSATGGIGTKTWKLTAGGTTVGPFAINTNTQTGLTNQTYTMRVEDSATPTPNFKIYTYAFNLPRRVGTSMTLYWVLQSSYPSPTSTTGWSSGTVETNTFTTGTTAQIFAAASKFLIGTSISTVGNVNFWVSDGVSYKQAFHPTSGDPDAFFEVAQNQTLLSTTGAGTAFPTPTRYAFTRYNVDVNCDDSNATEVWSFTNYSDGYYTIGGTLYRLVSASHTNYTTEITTATASSCNVCECVTIYNEGSTTGRYSYFRCSDGAEITRNITTTGGPHVVCIQSGTSINIISGTLTDSYCGTPCNTDGDCSVC
jgi:hypothetical protein